MDALLPRQSFVHSGGICVRAIYPSFLILSWEQPHCRGGDDASLSDRLAWSYTVEWSYACLRRHTPFRSGAPTPQAFAVIPIQHPGETLHVRVVSRGTLGGATVGITSAKRSLVATCDVAFPWLQPAALASPLLYHCLLLAANSGSPEVGVPASVRATGEGARLLESGLVVSLFSLHYPASPPRPVSDAHAILCVVAVGTGRSVAAARAAAPLRDAALWARAEEEGLALVFTGVGELGGSAALAAYALLAGLRAAGVPESALQRRVWCVAYGTPRRTLLQASATVLPAARLSGNVLFYSGAMTPFSMDGGRVGVLPSALPASGRPPTAVKAGAQTPTVAAASGGSDAGPPDAAVLDVSLGSRVGPVVDTATHRLLLYGEASTLCLPGDQERCECLDVARHLALLEGLCSAVPPTPPAPGREGDGEETGSQADSWAADSASGLAPVLSAISHEVVDSSALLLRVCIDGSNLHYSPQVMCLTHPGDEPLPMQIVSRSPSQLVCHASLVGSVCAACFAAGAVGAPAPALLAFSILVQTDMGIAAHHAAPSVLQHVQRAVQRQQNDRPPPLEATQSGAAASPMVRVPLFIAELLYKACLRGASTDSWLVDSPMRLIDAVISFLPYAVFDSAGRDAGVVERNLTASSGVRYLGHLAAAAEVATHYRARKPQHSLLAFVEKVAAKISSQAEGGSSGFSLSMQPLTEVAYLHGALRDLSLSSTTPIAAYLARMIPWKKRLFAGLPDLSESQYKWKLQWLLMALEGSDLSREQPLVSLELQIYSRVVQHLRSNHRSVVKPVVRGSTKSAVAAAGASSQVRGTVTALDSGPLLAGDVFITDTVTLVEFFDLTYPLFLHTLDTTTKEDVETAVVMEVCFLWSVCVLLQLRRSHMSSFQHHVAVAGCRGSGLSTVAAALTAIGRELSPAAGAVPPIVVKQVPEYGLVLLREMLSLGLAVTVVMTAELPDFGSLAFTAIARSIHSSVTAPRRQRVHVVLAKVDERLSLLAAEDVSALPERQVSCLVHAAVVTATAAAAQGSMMAGVPPVSVSLAPSLSNIRAALESVQSRVQPEVFAKELLHQSIERLRKLLLCDIEAAASWAAASDADQ